MMLLQEGLRYGTGDVALQVVNTVMSLMMIPLIVFTGSGGYSTTSTARTNVNDHETGVWYLHVQAKNAAGESEVVSVSAQIDTSKPDTPW